MRLAWMLVIAACRPAAPAPSTISNKAPGQDAGLLTITPDAFGPIRRDTQATLAGLRATLAGYEVRPANDSTLSYSVFLGDEKLAWVIPNDDGTVFNVHATSPKVATHGQDWRVGSAFHGAAQLTHCECWGDNPTCYRKGDHVAINFKRSCDGLVGADARALRVLDGIRIQRVIWSPTPFPEAASDDGDIAGPTAP